MASNFLNIFTTCKLSLGQGNIFPPVCHSVHKGELPGQVPPRQVHPPGQVQPPRQVHPLGRYPQTGTPRQVHPPDRYPPDRYPQAGTPPRQVPPWAGTPPGLVPPCQVHPPLRQVHPPLRQVPPARYTPSQAGTPPWAGIPSPRQVQAGSMHPTGMHSCFVLIVYNLFLDPGQWQKMK